MGWYLAPSLENLRDEINSRWPDRDKASDGTIGDQDHQNTSSDHNPNSRESVNAMDIDKDGVDVNFLMECYKKHPSTHYFIWNRKIYDKDNGFQAQNYTGSNPHDKHIHLSIRQSSSAEQNQTPWGVDDMPTPQDYANAVWANGGAQQLLFRVEAIFANRANSAQSGNAEVNKLAAKLDSLDQKLDELLAVPPGTVTVDQEQLEAAVRAVLGSVDGAVPPE